MGKFFKNRFNIFITIFISISIIIICQLINLQIIKGQEYSDMAQRKFLKESKLKALRGSIKDTNGIVLATNRQAFTVEIVNAGLKSTELNKLLLKLIKILEKNGDYFVKNLPISEDLSTFTGYIGGNQKIIEGWKKSFGIKDMNASPRACFDLLRAPEMFNIGEEYNDSEAWKIMNIRHELFVRGFLLYSPLIIASDISNESMVEVEELSMEFPGISTGVIPVRKYVNAYSAAHVIGYVRGISPTELEEKREKGYKIDDIIGKSGIEKVMEEELRGHDGIKKTEVDNRGRLTAEIETIPDIPGNNVILTIDSKLQNAAIKSLEYNIKKIREMPDSGNRKDAYSGAAVAIDVNTGAVLAMASCPTYDPSLFLADASDPDIANQLHMLNTDKNSTLLNKATMGQYAPASTFKILMAIAALEEGLVTPEETIYDKGVFTDYNINARCWIWPRSTHGNVDVSKAIKVSCNYFFYEMGKRLGIKNIDKWAAKFGLGESIGIGLEEASGARANPETKKKANQYDWYPGDTINASIGQGYNAFTPLQLAQYAATVANGGKRYRPYIVKSIEKYDGTLVKDTKTELIENIKLKPDTIRAIYEGMRGVTTETGGTATAAFGDFPITVGGKTGTAESPSSAFSDTGLFIGFAPYENPEIAVAVVVQNGVHGSNTAPIARDIMAEYFGLNEKPSQQVGTILPDEITMLR